MNNNRRNAIALLAVLVGALLYFNPFGIGSALMANISDIINMYSGYASVYCIIAIIILAMLYFVKRIIKP